MQKYAYLGKEPSKYWGFVWFKNAQTFFFKNYNFSRKIIFVKSLRGQGKEAVSMVPLLLNNS
jgi:hypothetical protein